MNEHPQVAAIDCEDCKKWAYDLKTGKRRLYGDEPIPIRAPPCATDDKVCPKGKPGHSDLTPENTEIVRLYLFCKSIGQWPEDIEFQRYRNLLDEVQRIAEAKLERRDQYQFLTNVTRSARRR